MQIANTLLNQLTYDSSNVRNKSYSATDFAAVLEKNYHTSALAGSLLKGKSGASFFIELRADAIISGGIFIDGKAVSASVYHSENHSSDNPVYTVIGKNIDGTPFEVDVNINNVDPRNASFVEMQALYAHLETTGQVSDRFIMNPFTGVFKGNYTNPDAFTKVDFFAPMMQMMEWQEANKNWESYNQYKKLIDVLMDYIQKHKEQTEFALQNINSYIDPLLTNITGSELLDWMNTLIKNGEMTLDESSPFLIFAGRSDRFNLLDELQSTVDVYHYLNGESNIKHFEMALQYVREKLG